jgi:hypothetical protein
MDRWDAPDSIFAPLIAAVPPQTHWSGFGNALIAAGESIPHPEMSYRTKKPGTLKWHSEIRERMLLVTTGEKASPFSARAFLFDKRPGEKVSNLATVRLWEVGMTRLKNGLCAPAVSEDFDTAILQVSKFQLTKAGLSGAPQLALLRHLWAEAVLSASPGAIVFGGQHHWQDDWWTEQLAESVES